VASTTLEKAGLPEQSHREPGRWQQSPVVMATGSPIPQGPRPMVPGACREASREINGKVSESNRLRFEFPLVGL
jgi:hypothetical protein